MTSSPTHAGRTTHPHALLETLGLCKLFPQDLFPLFVKLHHEEVIYGCES